MDKEKISQPDFSQEATPVITPGVNNSNSALKWIAAIIFVLILLVLGVIVFVLVSSNRAGTETDNILPTEIEGVTPTTTIEITPSISVSPSISPTPRTLSVSVGVNSQNTTDCSFNFVFSGEIYSPIAGDVSFVWENSDGGISPVQGIHFDEPGTKTAFYGWSKSQTYTGWYKLRITSPLPVTSNQMNVTKTCNHSGHWYTNFGDSTVSQTGTEGSIQFNDELMGGSSTINGTFTNDTFTGTYAGHPVTLVFTQNTVNGTWSQGTWCGAITGSYFPSGCSFAGVWNEYVGGLFFESERCQPGNTTLSLSRRNNEVSGTYCNGSLTGTVSYDWTSRMAIVTGEYSARGGGSGSIEFYLLNGDNSFKKFSGNYDGTDEWCGWRVGQVQPVQCLFPAP